MKERSLVVKDWIEKSDWRTWFVVGIVIMVSMTVIRNVVIDHGVNRKRQQILEAIDAQEKAMQEERAIAEKGDQKVNVDFDHAEQSGQKLIMSTEDQMAKTKQEMSQEK